ncbi:MAG TPA: site-specific integrase [Bacteroidales bacterium]|nr:site-specific integrase [Bacteroidales bacterium]
MKTEKSTFRILFYLKRTKTLNNGESTIFMRITVDGERAEVSTHQSVESNLWNQEKGIVKGVSSSSKQMNDYLEHLKLKVYRHKKELESNDQEVTARILGDLLQGKNSQRKGLVELFLEHNKRCRELVGKDIAPATLTRYETTLMHVQSLIQTKYRQQDIPLKSVNHEFIKNFEHYLKTVRNCGHNTTVKYIRNLRKIIRIALSNDWLKKDPFRSISYRLKEVNRAYLTDMELKLLLNKKFSNERLRRIKDIFLFSCFTGLAFSDVKSLTRENITIGINNQKWLRTKRKKTGNPSEIPLLDVPNAIINKYENDPICLLEQKLLPVGSNQKMNAYLKEIADLCGINKNLSTHTARHTFATTVTLTHGVSMEAVSKMLGHSNIATTKQYARIVDTLIINEMKKVQQLYQVSESIE